MSEYQQFQQQKIQLQTQSDALLDAVIAYPQTLDATHIEVFIQEMKRDLSFNVLCIGDFSSGKTTFVNTFLIEDDLLPAKARPTTTRLTEIQYGEKLVAHIINADGEVHTITEHVKETLEGHVVSGGEHVDSTALVRIETPSKALSEGVLVIDSPGLNDPDVERMKITFDYLHQADAVLYFLNAQQAWTKNQKEFLEGEILGKNELDKLFFMLNYWDCIDEHEREELLEYIQDEMNKSLRSAHKGGATPPDLIPISAKTGEGVDAVKDKIWGYLSSAKEKVVQQKIHKLITYIDQYVHMADEQALLAQEEEEAIAVKKEKLEVDVVRYKKESERHLQNLRSNLEVDVADFQAKCESVLESYVADVRTVLNSDEISAASNLEKFVIGRTSTIENELRSSLRRLYVELQKKVRSTVGEWQGRLQIPVNYLNMDKNYLLTPDLQTPNEDNNLVTWEKGATTIAAAGGATLLTAAGTGVGAITNASGVSGAIATWLGGTFSPYITVAAFGGSAALVIGLGAVYLLKQHRDQKRQEKVSEIAEELVQQARTAKAQLLSTIDEEGGKLLDQVCQNVDFEVRQLYQQKQDELDALGSNKEAGGAALRFKQTLLDIKSQVVAQA